MCVTEQQPQPRTNIKFLSNTKMCGPFSSFLLHNDQTEPRFLSNGRQTVVAAFRRTYCVELLFQTNVTKPKLVKPFSSRTMTSRQTRSKARKCSKNVVISGRLFPGGILTEMTREKRSPRRIALFVSRSSPLTASMVKKFSASAGESGVRSFLLLAQLELSGSAGEFGVTRCARCTKQPRKG